MDFRNRVKGAVTQSLVRSLLEDAKYRVVPLGVEDVIREVSALDAEQYSRLNLPNVLRRLPDFFVASNDMSGSWLLEVKYRKSWSNATREALGRAIREQVLSWKPLHLAVFLGESTRPGNDLPTHSIGVVSVTEENGSLLFKSPTGLRAWSTLEWSDFSRLQDVFRDVTDRWGDQTILRSLAVLRGLSGVELFE